MKYARFLTIGLMLLSLAAIGCSGKDKGDKSDKPEVKKDKDNEHEHGPGPNNGVVFDFGKYHAEFTVKHDKKQCMIVILGADEKTEKAVEAKNLTVNTKPTKTKDGKEVPAMEIKMEPQGAAGGKASRYIGTNDTLGMVADFQGTVVGEIDGKPTQGKFEEK